MKFGEVFDFRNADEARQYIGKKGVFSDSLWDINKRPAEKRFGTLVDANGNDAYPFMRLDEDGRRVPFEFFRPILEEELMTNRQLAEWLAKGKGEMTLENNDSYIYTEKVHFKGDADKPVRDDVIIRHWGDSEWSKPTKAIYEEDCIPNTAINKEDCKC